MVKESNTINCSYWTCPYVCLRMIFFNGRILQPFMKICWFCPGWNLKHETFLGILVYTLLSACFHIICMWWVRICKITFCIWCPSSVNKQSKIWPPKPQSSFLYFCYILLHDIWFLHDLELINLCPMIFDKNDLYLISNLKWSPPTHK